MEKFELHILGCGSALPTTRHFPTSQILNVRDKLFMIDCGEGAQLQFRKSRLKFSRLNHIFISHLHGDHCFGLLGLISTLNLLGRTAELHIHSPQGLEELLKPMLDFFNHQRGPFADGDHYSLASSDAYLRFSVCREAASQPHHSRDD